MAFLQKSAAGYICHSTTPLRHFPSGRSTSLGIWCMAKSNSISRNSPRCFFGRNLLFITYKTLLVASSGISPFGDNCRKTVYVWQLISDTIPCDWHFLSDFRQFGNKLSGNLARFLKTDRVALGEKR